MAKSLDIAVVFLEKSIEKGIKNPGYHMNCVKLHKLMYLGQCLLNYRFGMDLFEEKITAEHNGPYIEGLELVMAKYGFDNIKNIDALKKHVINFPLSISRNETIDFILDMYGQYSTAEIVKMTKNTRGWQLSYNESNSQTHEIGYELIKETGEELFKDIVKPFSMSRYQTCAYLCATGACPKTKKKTM